MIDKAALQSWLPQVRAIAEGAGAILMKHYSAHAADPGSLAVEIKDDKSPVTIADHESSALIVAELQKLTPHIVVISEENSTRDVPENGLYWAVDPLDGTKGFIARNDHFYTKIALIENGRPILGVIFEPVHGRSYYAVRDGGAFSRTAGAGEKSLAAGTLPPAAVLRTVFNSLHFRPESYDAARTALRGRGLDVPEMAAAKGMCKTAFYMAVATGEADLFVNCGTDATLRGANGHVWDYAPDSLILWNAGGVIVDLSTGRVPVFDKPAEKMNAMIGLCDRNLGKRIFPDLKNDCV